MAIKSLDLFAGVGGIRLGFESANFQTVFANDLDPYCKMTYDYNFSDPKLTVKDIWEIPIGDIPDFDILMGGFPCQPFSIAGYRKGFEDERKGNLFYRIVDIVESKRPKALFLENVKNLKTHDGGHTYLTISYLLADLGYWAKSVVLNSKTHGNIPQNRERIFIVAFDNKEDLMNFKFPTEIPLTKSFKDFLLDEVDEKYHYNGKYLYDKIKDDVTSEDTVYQWRRSYVRDNKNKVVPAFTASMGTAGNNVPIIKQGDIIRKLTPQECFWLQGFPKSYKLPDIADTQLYKQIGNSVTVTVIERIAKELSKVL